MLHSGSKFISGHNDTIAGFLTCADQELADRVRLIAKTTGGMLAPFACWLTIRGLKTLSVRMERQQANALRHFLNVAFDKIVSDYGSPTACSKTYHGFSCVHS